MRYPAIIFDIDGIIVDSEPIHMDLRMEVYKRLQIDVPRKTHFKFIGGSAKRKWQTEVDLPLLLS